MAWNLSKTPAWWKCEADRYATLKRNRLLQARRLDLFHFFKSFFAVSYRFRFLSSAPLSQPPPIPRPLGQHLSTIRVICSGNFAAEEALLPYAWLSLTFLIWLGSSVRPCQGRLFGGSDHKTSYRGREEQSPHTHSANQDRLVKQQRPRTQPPPMYQLYGSRIHWGIVVYWKHRMHCFQVVFFLGGGVNYKFIYYI